MLGSNRTNVEPSHWVGGHFLSQLPLCKVKGGQQGPGVFERSIITQWEDLACGSVVQCLLGSLRPRFSSPALPTTKDLCSFPTFVF